jgi:nucleoside 2-deoxyribosyltransferase
MKKKKEQKTCFFLMPFSAPFNEYYEQVFKPAVIEAGFKPYRADEIYGSRPFMQDILDSIKKSDVILAEITGRNPNVMYEMGVAYAWKKPIVILSQTMEDVPFDLRHYRVLIYKTIEPNWPSKLRSGIVEAVLEAERS